MARKILAVIVLVASVALALEAAGQTTTGGITGVVRDSGGALIPGATVTATHEGTNARSDGREQRPRRLRVDGAGRRPPHHRRRAGRVPDVSASGRAASA